MTGPLEWLKKPLIVRASHEEKNRYEASRYLTRPAIFPNGEPGIAVYSSGRIIAVFPEVDAERFLFHLGKSLERARRATQ